jgi:hypothetical protein
MEGGNFWQILSIDGRPLALNGGTYSATMSHLRRYVQESTYVAARVTPENVLNGDTQ